MCPSSRQTPVKIRKKAMKWDSWHFLGTFGLLVSRRRRDVAIDLWEWNAVEMWGPVLPSGSILTMRRCHFAPAWCLETHIEQPSQITQSTVL